MILKRLICSINYSISSATFAVFAGIALAYTGIASVVGELKGQTGIKE